MPAPCSPLESPLVTALFADLGLRPAEVSTTLDRRDEMVAFLERFHGGDRDQALYAYFRSGWSIADALLQVLRWRFGATLADRRVLDFASGYGRVTRFLLRELARERVWVADVYAEAVRHQEAELGVRGLVSTPDPAGFAGAETFDAVLVTSLFTHLPAERFGAWLRRLGALVAPGGLLAFSVHDPSVLPADREVPDSGLLFEATSESGSLAPSEYGSTWASEAFVRGAVAEALADASLLRLERGLCNFQDLYVAVREPRGDPPALAFRGEPQVFVERCGVAEPDVLTMAGWAARRGSGRLVAIEAWLDGELRGRWPVAIERPEVAELFGDARHRRSGWEGSLRLPAGVSRSRAVLLLRAVDEAGHGFPAHAGSLERHLLVGTGHDLIHARRELERAAVRHAADTAALQSRIAAMEASRFWKLRNRWFALKRFLRLTDEP